MTGRNSGCRCGTEFQSPPSTTAVGCCCSDRRRRTARQASGVPKDVGGGDEQRRARSPVPEHLHQRSFGLRLELLAQLARVSRVDQAAQPHRAGGHGVPPGIDAHVNGQARLRCCPGSRQPAASTQAWGECCKGELPLAAAHRFFSPFVPGSWMHCVECTPWYLGPTPPAALLISSWSWANARNEHSCKQMMSASYSAASLAKRKERPGHSRSSIGQ
eukprot:scaffold8780_cov130-Isochrysis_galbana.AAC.16